MIKLRVGIAFAASAMLAGASAATAQNAPLNQVYLGTGVSTSAAFETLSGDCAMSSATLGAINCTKTNGTAFGTAATQDTGLSGATLCLLTTSCTWSGAQSFSSGFLTSTASVNGAAGTYRPQYFLTSGAIRWAMYADNSAESGSNSGSNFAISNYSDAGASLGVALNINRATGVVTAPNGFSTTSLTGLTTPLAPQYGGTGNISVTAYGAACNGSGNDATAFQNGLNAASAAGGGAVTTPFGVTCAIGTTLIMPANVTLVINGTLKWNGAAAGPIFKTPTGTPTGNWGIVGSSTRSTLDLGGMLTGDVFSVDSGQVITIQNLMLVDGSGLGTVFDFHPDISPYLGNGSTNLALMNISNIFVEADIGTCLKFNGTAVTGGDDVVTNSTFYNLQCAAVEAYGANFVQWADTNRFYSTYFQLRGSGSDAVVFNSGAPTSANGVYANTFYGIAVDTFAPGSFNRTGIVVNYSYADAVYDYEQYPVAENGPLVINGTGNSYDLSVTYLNPGSHSRYVVPGQGSMFATPSNTGGGSGPAIMSGTSVTTTGTVGLGAGGSITVQAGATGWAGMIELKAGSSGTAFSGSFQLNLPQASTNQFVCIFQPYDNGANWVSPWSFVYSPASPTAVNVIWQNASTPLTLGGNYFLAYNCLAD